MNPPHVLAHDSRGFVSLDSYIFVISVINVILNEEKKINYLYNIIKEFRYVNETKSRW